MSYSIKYNYDGAGPYNAIIEHASSEFDAIAQLKKRVSKPHLIAVLEIYET